MRIARVHRSWIIVALTLGSPAMAQHEEHDLPHRDSLKQDSRSIDIMRRGRLTGRSRQYSMATVNDGAPQDFYAVAFGGVMGYTSERWHGVRFRMAAGFTFDLSSTTFADPDPVTGQFSRYELGLFDVTDPERVEDLSYLHEFQLDHLSRNGRHRTVFGKQELNTPFLNPQDGRMHPTLFEGLWHRTRLNDRTELQGGWIYRVAPRGTSKWYHVDESTQIYPTGRNILGNPSYDGDHQRSLGVFAASAKYRSQGKVSVTVWDVMVENMFNTAMAQVEAGDKESPWSVSGMAVHQTTVARGRLAEPEFAYMPNGEDVQAYSARLRQVLGRFRWQANYTRITRHGRYLMPREWGRDPFFTFLPRERNEGLGDVHATTLNLILRDLRPGLRIEMDGGAYWLPPISDARMNKYAMPSYAQYVLNTQYQFQGGWKGAAIQLLYLYKMPLFDQDLNERQAINKVDMHHVNLIFNYAF